MSIPLVQSMAARSGKSLKAVEQMWGEAKEKSRDAGDADAFYALSTTLLKEMLNLKDDETAAAVKVGAKKYKSIYEVPNIWVLNIVSNVLDEAAYDPATNILYLNFKSGTTTDWYMYLDVPLKVFNAFSISESKGVFFSKNIRTKYTATKISAK